MLSNHSMKNHETKSANITILKKQKMDKLACAKLKVLLKIGVLSLQKAQPKHLILYIFCGSFLIICVKKTANH